MSEKLERHERIAAAQDAVQGFEQAFRAKDLSALAEISAKLRNIVGDVIEQNDNDMPIELLEIEMPDQVMGIQQYRIFLDENEHPIDDQIIRAMVAIDGYIKAMQKVQ